MTGQRPLPHPTELSLPFWQAAAEGRLVLPFVAELGRAFFPPEPTAPGLPHAPWVWREFSGRGVVYSATEVHRAPAPGFTAPFLLAVVELDEGAVLLTHLVDLPAALRDAPDPAAASIGLRVQVRFRALSETISVAEFAPIAQPS